MELKSLLIGMWNFMGDKKICIVGLGYVGLPLAVAFAEKFTVVGFDTNISRIEQLKNCNDITGEIAPHSLSLVRSNLSFTENILAADGCDFYIVTVPTPIDSKNQPDLSPLIGASKAIGSVLSHGNIVIYESTVYPGVTEDVCVPVLEKTSNLYFNRDFFCGYSPERINPGDKEHTVTQILKVTSGSTPECAFEVDSLYKEIITAGTHLASSIKIAEASKVIENIQRDVNIALMNELALIFNEMGINTHEVIDAASTKWNFINLKPGLVGGHCIGVDPYYLTFRATELGFNPDLILTARHINNSMAKHISDQTIKEIVKSGKTVKGARILVLGVTFKENCTDMRNTKVTEIIAELKDSGMLVDVYDPWVNLAQESTWYKHGIIKDPLSSDIKYDAIVVAVGHDEFKNYMATDYEHLSSGKKVIIDVKNIVGDATWTL